jgi:hypothetical protein
LCAYGRKIAGTHREGEVCINTHMVSRYPQKDLTKCGIPHGNLKYSEILVLIHQNMILNLQGLSLGE